MPKTVSATEAKNRLGELMGWVVQNKDEVIVESRGEPKVVVIPFDEYELIKKAKEQERRRQILEEIRELQRRVRARNQDLSEEEADALADRFVRDVIDDMEREGKIRFSP